MSGCPTRDPATHERHLIHGEGRTWAETNCYVDVLVELLHGLGFEPIAALPFTLRIAFEGDQWTFFKFPHADLLTLFGLDIQELNPWQSLVDHVDRQVALGRPVLVELDSFYLPDTQGTAYKQEHIKSTVAVNAIDVGRREMGYFHGQGYYHLSGSDFAQVFQIDGLPHDRILPPYIEFVKSVQAPVTPGAPLLQASLECLTEHLRLLPEEDPFNGFRLQLQEDLKWLVSEPIETFHRYSFATLRQYGACFELAETYLRWLSAHGEPDLDQSIAAFCEISQASKAFQFQLARAVTRGRELSLDPLDRMADLRNEALRSLSQRYG